MKEEFLHFIWQYLHFDSRNLKLDSGETLQILRQGNYQTNAGPDFENCEIKIGNILWVGNIEIHLKSSDWNRHHHQKDPSYNNVILHVVWENDAEVQSNDGQVLPVLSLKDRVEQGLLDRYDQLIQGKYDILCHLHFEEIDQLKKVEMLDKAVGHRLKIKSDQVLTRLEKNEGDWEETAYQLLMQNFGFKVNSDVFLMLSLAVPYRVIKKHADHSSQIEALLYGQSGLLDNCEDPYGISLKQEYDFLSKKYQLKDRKLPAHRWKRMRIRPANFPAVRISQLVAIFATIPNLLDLFISISTLKEITRLIRTPVPAYWHNHYDFGKPSDRVSVKIGKKSIENIVINTVVPLLAAFSRYRGQTFYMDHAVALLESIKTENNHITRKWEAIGFSSKTAFDSQGLIMQFNELCKKKKCLSCSIGMEIVNR